MIKYAIYVPRKGYIVPSKVLEFNTDMERAEKWKTLKKASQHLNNIKRNCPKAEIHELEYTVKIKVIEKESTLTEDEIIKRIETNTPFKSICSTDFTKKVRFLYRNGYDDPDKVWVRGSHILSYDKYNNILRLG